MAFIDVISFVICLEPFKVFPIILINTIFKFGFVSTAALAI